MANRQIKKVAVLGSGVMGSRIACHFANIGAEVLLLDIVPKEEWTGLSLRLILHGRRVCDARRPRCEECVLNDFCPSSLVRPGRPLRSASRRPRIGRAGAAHRVAAHGLGLRVASPPI